MASVHRKRGASGAVSPYWNAKLKDPNGTVWTLTREETRSSSGGVWETASEVARNGRVSRALSFHSLRHSFVTQLHCSGVPIEVRKALAGSSDAMSLNYTQVSRALTAAAIAQIPGVGEAA
jgi:site-specific recombinase XerD